MFKHAPWKSHEEGKPPEDKEQDDEKSLTTILDIDQRGELTLLIASIMAAMRKTIEANFDATVGSLKIRYLRLSCSQSRI